MRPTRIAMAITFALLTGCGAVAPWERGTLAAPRMQLDLDPDESAMLSSLRRTREEGVIGGSGSAGGSSAGGGGGCGCH